MATPAELIDDSRCIDCGISDGQKLSILISLFATLTGVSADPTTLMANARCIDSCIPPGMRLSVLISLLDAYVNGGGSGTGCLLSTSGDPEGVLTSACSPAMAVDPANGALYLFTGTAGTNVGWAFKA